MLSRQTHPLPEFAEHTAALNNTAAVLVVLAPTDVGIVVAAVAVVASGGVGNNRTEKVVMRW